MNNSSRIAGIIMLVIFVIASVLCVVLAITLVISSSIPASTICLPGSAVKDGNKYGDCVPCGMNRYSADGFFCFDCPYNTYTCSETATTENMCVACLNATLDLSTNSTICITCKL